jgi:transposase
MGRPPTIPAEVKTRVVLSVLAGEVTIAEAARREKISEQLTGCCPPPRRRRLRRHAAGV